MYDPGADVLAALRGAHHRAGARLTSLDASRAVRHVWQDATALLLDGSAVSGDRTRSVRRSVSLAIADPTGEWTPSAPGDPFFGGEWLRVERGVRVGGGGMTWIPLFTGTVTSFDDTMRGTLQVTGEDALGLCQQPFGDATSVTSGTRAQDAVVALLGPALGVTQDWTLDDAGRTVPDRSWSAEDDRLQSTWQLMADLGLELFADRMGVVVLRPIPDPTLATPVRTLASPSATGVILSGTRTGSRLPYNQAVVIAELPDGTIIRAQADVTDPASPIHRSRIGLRVAPVYRSSQIPDQSAANAVARNRLVEYALYQDGYAGDIVPDPTLDPGDVIAVRQGITGTDGNYLLDTVSHPITTGTTSLGATRVLPVR